MSNYGNPPSDPYGQNPQDPSGAGGNPQDPYGQNPYAQSGQGDPGQNPYGAPSTGQPGYGLPQGVSFAHWGKRVLAYLIDFVLTALSMILYLVGVIIAASSVETSVDPVTGQVTTEGGASGLAVALIVLGVLMGLAFVVWNFFIKQGRTGYTVGKGIIGIKLVKAETGQPIGAGMAFVRQIAHFLDSIPCSIGYLWPLWDAKRQTFADKVIGTYVIDQPKG